MRLGWKLYIEGTDTDSVTLERSRLRAERSCGSGGRRLVAWRPDSVTPHRESGLDPSANVYFLVGGRSSESLKSLDFL